MGLRVRALNAHRHRLRTDAAYSDKIRFEQEVVRRRDVVVTRPMGLGSIDIHVTEPFTLDECQYWNDKGFGVPMDLLPIEYWHPRDMPFPRFGEEMLGDEF